MKKFVLEVASGSNKYDFGDTIIGTDEFGEELDKIGDDLRENATNSGGYSSKDEEIWKYCVDRWDHYDELACKYSGDKYTQDVFNDAALKFGISVSKAESIWKKVDGAKLGL